LVKEALDQFVGIRLARQTGGDNYEVYFRKHQRKDISTRNLLLNLFCKSKKKEKDADQTRLDKFIKRT